MFAHARMFVYVGTCAFVHEGGVKGWTEIFEYSQQPMDMIKTMP